MSRADHRPVDALRPVTIETGAQAFPAGSVLISAGLTRVLCAASVAEEVPRWRRGSGLGWVTAEYAMLPSATSERTPREAVRGRLGGRTHEIQRLIGRSLRSCIDLADLGERTITVDCDVIQADGGTRTAAITGGWVALRLALDALVGAGALPRLPRIAPLSAVSVGIVEGEPRLDLDYVEDAAATVDMNVVMTGDGRFVEVQGTAEESAFSRAEHDALLDLAAMGCAVLVEHQEAALAGTDAR